MGQYMINTDGTIEQDKVFLCDRLLRKRGEIYPIENLKTDMHLDSNDEVSFILYKNNNGVENPLWDKVDDLAIILVEGKGYFEISVPKTAEDCEYKSITGISLGEAETSQTKITIEFNTETDFMVHDYKPTVLCDFTNTELSMLHRALKSMPHYSIGHVDDSIKSIQRTFTFSNVTMQDMFNQIAEEIGCIFIFDNFSRTINCYDLQEHCLNGNCVSEGNDRDIVDGVCQNCGSSEDVVSGYGEYSGVFVDSTENLAETITVTGDKDSVKNCFKIEGADDVITNRLSNRMIGGNYLWKFSDYQISQMSTELQDALVARQNLISTYQDTYETYWTQLNSLTEKKLYYESGMMPSHETDETTAEAVFNEIFGADGKITYGCTSSKYQSAESVKESLLVFARLIAPSTYTTELTLSGFTTTDDNGLAVVNSVSLVAHIYLTGEYEDDGTTLVDEYTSSVFTLPVRKGYNIYNDTSDTSVFTYEYYEYLKRQMEIVEAKSEITDDVIIFDPPITDGGAYNPDTTPLLYAEYDNETNPDNLSSIHYTMYCINRLDSFYSAYEACSSVLEDSTISADSDNLLKYVKADGTQASIYEALLGKYSRYMDCIASRRSYLERKVADIDAQMETLNTDIQKINAECDMQTFLGKYSDDLWVELCSFRREDTYKNDNYIGDGVSEETLMGNIDGLIKQATLEINKACEVHYSISTTIGNLLVMDEFKPLWDNFKLGNYIKVRIDDEIYNLRLITISYEDDDISHIGVEFSDITKEDSSVQTVSDVLKQAQSIAGSFNYVAKQANNGNNVVKDVEEIKNQGLDLTNTQITTTDGIDVLINKYGILGRKWDDAENAYSPEQFRIINNILAFTTDGWKTTRTALGKILYYNDETHDYEWRYGLNAELLIADIILGNNLKITSESGNFTISNDGFVMGSGDKFIQFDPTNPSLVISNGIETLLSFNANGDNKLLFGSSVTLPWSQITDTQDVVTTDTLNANIANITTANIIQAFIDNGFIGHLEAEFVGADRIEAIEGEFETLESDVANFKDTTTETITAIRGDFTTLSGDVATFKTTITNSITAIEGDFDTLSSDVATFKTTVTDSITAFEGDFDELSADVATFKTTVTDSITAITGDFNELSSDLATFKNTTTENLTATNGRITTLSGDLADYKKVVAGDITAVSGRIGTLETNAITTSTLSANLAKIDVAVVGDTFTDSLTALSTSAAKSVIDQAYILDAVVNNMTVADLKTKVASAETIALISKNGKTAIGFKNATQQFYDSNGNVRVQIGQDATGAFNFLVRGTDGTTALFDENGIKTAAIPDSIIVTDMLADGSVSKEKINFPIIEPNAQGGVDITQVYDGDEKFGVEYTSFKSEITQSVADAQTAADDAQADIDGLAIGGRNLARSVYGTGTLRGYTPTTAKNSCFTYAYIYPVGLSVGDTVTVSIDVEYDGVGSSSDGTFAMWTQGSIDDKWSGSNPFADCIGYFENKMTGTSGKIHLVGQFIVPAYVLTHTKYEFGVRSDYSNGTATFKFQNLMVSRGNKELDWTPAPEDIESQFTTLTNTISGVSSVADSVSKSITNKVWQTDITTAVNNYDGSTVKTIRDRVSKTETDIEGITSTVSDISANTYTKTEVDQKADSWMVTAKAYTDTAVDETIVDVSVEYYLSTSATALSGGSWSVTAPTWTDGKYMWTRTTKTYGDGSKESTDATCISGATGQGVASYVQQYYQSTSSTTQTGGSWSATAPTWADGKYIWTRTIVTYTDGTSTTTSPVCVTGAKGSSGVSITGMAEHYQVSSSNTTAPTTWVDTAPSMTTTNRYLWNYETISYSDGTTEDTTKRVIGVYGNTGATGATGTTGNGISSVTNYYLATTASSGVTTSTSGWTTTPQTTTATKKYLWNYEVIKYTNNSTTTTTPCIIGTYGDKGETGATGATGVGISNVAEHYQVSSSATTAPTSWVTTVPTMTTTNKYLWNYETITYTNGTTSDTAKRVIGVYGNTGATGSTGATGATGNGISAVTNYYLATASASGVTTTTSGWTTAVQSVSATKKYLWNYEVVRYTNNSTTTTTPCIIGAYGDKGNDGVSVTGITEKYQVSSSNSTAPTSWVNTAPTMTTTNKYLWNYEVISYSDGTTSETTKRVIGVYGNTGATGSTGATGNGVSSVTNHYLATTASSGVTTSTSGWTTTVQTTTATKKYLWNYETIAYTNGTSVNSTPCIIGTYGDKGEKGDTGTGITDVDVMYYLSTSATALSGGSWSTTAPTWVDGKYVWSKTVTTLTTGATTESTAVCITGGQGATGSTGKSVSSITEEYYLSTSKTTQTGGSWTTTPPTWSSGMYVWTRSKIVYTNPSSTAYTTPVCDSSWEAVNEIEVGGRNLVLKSGVQHNSTGYLSYMYDLSEMPVEGEIYTVTLKGTKTDGAFGIWFNGGITQISVGIPLCGNSTNVYQYTFVCPANVTYQTISVYNYPSTATHNTAIEWIKLERGNKATPDWTPAPEDIYANIASVKVNADKISLLVKSGDSESNMVLTDRLYSLMAENIDLTGKVTFSSLASDAQTKINTAQSTANTAASNASAIANNIYTSGTTTINGGKITTGSITATQIASNAITAVKISSGAITTDKLAANAVTAAKIAAGTITATQIASSAITSAKIAAGAITTDKIAAGAITAAKINVTDLFSQNITATGTITGVKIKSIGDSSTTTIDAGKIDIDITSLDEFKGVEVSNGGYGCSLRGKYIDVGSGTHHRIGIGFGIVGGFDGATISIIDSDNGARFYAGLKTNEDAEETAHMYLNGNLWSDTIGCDYISARTSMTVGNGLVTNLTETGHSMLFGNGLVISNPATRNDQGWIRVLGSAETNSGAHTILEIATGDDGGAGEAIVVRQYNTDNSYRQAQLLDIDGNTYFPNTVHASGINVTGTITSSKMTHTHLLGNKGDAIINSTASAGTYTMLTKMNSENGYFCHGTYENRYSLYYTTKTLVDSGKNGFTYEAILLNESGNTTFPGALNAKSLSAASANLSGNITFSPVTSTTYPATSAGLCWSGSTDGAYIYYRVDEADAGRLVFNLVDDANTLFCFAYYGKDVATINSSGQFSGSAAKLTTARTLTIGSTGKSFDGSANVSWSLSEIGAATTSHTHGLLHSDLCVNLSSTTTDSGWSMLNPTYSGHILKSIRTDASAPSWILGNYSSGIVFGGADTKGVISVSYSSPLIRFAGGNSTKPVWYCSITGTSGATYNLDNFSVTSHTHSDYVTKIETNGSSMQYCLKYTTAGGTETAIEVLSARRLFNNSWSGTNYNTSVYLVQGAFIPSVSGSISCGSSAYKWSTVYASTSTISTSDRNQKHNISYVGDESEYDDTIFSDDKVVELIRGIKSAVYKFNDGTSDRPHHGLIAQDFEELMERIGISDHAGFIKSPREVVEYDEDGNPTFVPVDGEYDYAFRYEELITDLIRFAQILDKRLSTIESKLSELEC